LNRIIRARLGWVEPRHRCYGRHTTFPCCKHVAHVRITCAESSEIALPAHAAPGAKTCPPRPHPSLSLPPPSPSIVRCSLPLSTAMPRERRCRLLFEDPRSCWKALDAFFVKRPSSPFFWRRKLKSLWCVVFVSFQMNALACSSSFSSLRRPPHFCCLNSFFFVTCFLFSLLLLWSIRVCAQEGRRFHTQPASE
jgi:hypothetical protein